MSKEIAKKETSEVATADYSKYVDAPKMETLTSQIIIPRIAITQKMSPVVGDQKAKVGDLFDYGASQVLTEQGKPFKFIPVFCRMVKPEEKLEGNAWVKTKKIIPLTAKNEKDKWDYEINGEKYRARPEFQVYCFTPSQLPKIDESVPYLMTLRGTSMKHGGKTLYTTILVTQGKMPMFSKVFTMTTILDQEGKNNWYYAHVDQKTEHVEGKYLDPLFHWSQNISKLADSLQIVGEEEIDEASAASSNGSLDEQF